MRLRKIIGEQKQKQIPTNQVEFIFFYVICVAFVTVFRLCVMYYLLQWKCIIGRLAFLTHNE